MRKFYYLALVALVGIALSSCSLFGGGGGGSNDPEFRLGDLQGLWQRNNTKEFIRFTTEQSEESPYLLGYEWDEKDWDDPDMTAEEFLLSERELLGKPGNGWFKYWFETTTGGLHELHLMNNSPTETPKEYIVTQLTDTDLEYYEKEHTSNKYKFQKVVTAK